MPFILTIQYNSGTIKIMKLQIIFALLSSIAILDHTSAWSLEAYAPNYQPGRILTKNSHENLVRANPDDTVKLGYLILTKLQELVAAVSQKDVLANVGDPVCASHLAHIFYQLDLWINKGILPDTFVLQRKFGFHQNRCSQDILKYHWLISVVIDSWGKLPSGILSGHLAEPGDFLECIEAEGYLNASFAPGYVKGTYSMGMVGFSPQAVGRDTLPGPAPNKTNGGAVAPDVFLVGFLTSY